MKIKISKEAKIAIYWLKISSTLATIAVDQGAILRWPLSKNAEYSTKTVDN